MLKTAFSPVGKTTPISAYITVIQLVFLISPKPVSSHFPLRTNDTGRIYGVTFFDLKNQVVINGSRLGKEFSANAFNDLFSKSQTPEAPQNRSESTATDKLPEKHPETTATEKQPAQPHFQSPRQVQDASQQKPENTATDKKSEQSHFQNSPQGQDIPQHRPETPRHAKNNTESTHESTVENSYLGASENTTESILGIFSFDPNGTDPEEEAFTKRMQPKKKKGRKR